MRGLGGSGKSAKSEGLILYPRIPISAPWSLYLHPHKYNNNKKTRITIWINLFLQKTGMIYFCTKVPPISVYGKRSTGLSENFKV